MKLVVTFLKFAVVGTITTAVDFIVTALFMLIMGMGEYISESISSLSSSDVSGFVMAVILLANLMGFIFSVSVSYMMNRFWTWKSDNPEVRKQYVKFFSVSVAGLLINLLVIYLCNSYLTIEFTIFGIFFSRFWIAKIVATAVVMFWNFFVNHFYTFKQA